MMRALVIAGMLAVSLGQAAAQGAWCSDDMVSRNCGFHTLAQCQRSRTCAFFTFEQCLAFVHGAGGYCVPNPYLAYAPPPDGRAPPKRPRGHYDR